MRYIKGLTLEGLGIIGRVEQAEAEVGDWKRRYDEAIEQVSVRETTLERLEAEVARLHKAKRKLLSFCRALKDDPTHGETARLYLTEFGPENEL